MIRFAFEPTILAGAAFAIADLDAAISSGLLGLLLLPRPPASLSRREVAALAGLFAALCAAFGPLALPVQAFFWVVNGCPRFWWRRR